MATATVTPELKLRKLDRQVRLLRSEFGQLKALVEDSLLSAEESQLLDEAIAKIEQGDRSDFVKLGGT